MERRARVDDGGLEPFESFATQVVVIPDENIDTDQIIPARFLKVTDKEGLGEALFADWRYDASGRPNPEFVLNQPGTEGAAILVAGHNFGCGSSREHAPWALRAFGFRAVISTFFADIFRNNALKNGLLPIVVAEEIHRELLGLDGDPTARVRIDLESQSLTLPTGKRVEFPIDPFAKYCLLNGLDQLGFLLAEEGAIARYEAERVGRWSVSTLEIR